MHKHTFQVASHSFEVDRKYKLIKSIGQGAFGVVCSCENEETKQKVAIKKIARTFSNLIETKRAVREVKLLRTFRHPNVVSIIDIIAPNSWEEFTDLYLVTELMSTDLHQIIASPQPLSEEHAQYFVYQILRGLKYLHSTGAVHRDLKPSNLLLNSNCDLKICDLGLARGVDEEDSHQLTEYVSTRWYRAPEVMLCWKNYDKAIDMWSVGCIMAEILSRKPLFPGRDYLHQLTVIIDILGTPSDDDLLFISSEKALAYIRSLPHRSAVPFRSILPQASPEAIDLLERMVAFSPQKRITVEEALRHPWLKKLHDPNDEVCQTGQMIFFRV